MLLMVSKIDYVFINYYFIVHLCFCSFYFKKNIIHRLFFYHCIILLKKMVSLYIINMQLKIKSCNC